MKRQAIIIGAGPAGLTAGLELLRRTDVQSVLLEASQEIGGISRTIRYKGNRMDIGGHRFFSKSDRVMQWWTDLLPPELNDVEITYQGQRRTVAEPVVIETVTEETEAHGHTEMPVHSPVDPDLVMLVRPRKSRIYYMRKFFDYPIRLSGKTISNLGLLRVIKIGWSYLSARLRPIQPERSLEDFLINRFGRQLYVTFFKSYTEKVWGVPCDKISAEWGAQRIKGLSLTTAVRHFVRGILKGKPQSGASSDLAQKGTDTSLIERFLYPKYGPGQLWEHVADRIVAGGGEIHMGWRAVRVLSEGDRVTGVEAENDAGERRLFSGEFVISTMPVRELTAALEKGGAVVPANVREVSDGLQYRDFITVGVLARKLRVEESHEPGSGPTLADRLIRDNWIYVQEPEVQLGRLQIFNNWSPHMVADGNTVWMGLEYFCYETDPLWSMPDEELKRFAIAELETIGILDAADALDAHVVRVAKTYPAYFGTYDRFPELRQFFDRFENLFLVGRNGMHKYNNQDHSMLTAMAVVDGIAAGKVDHAAVWEINTEQEYHEEKK